MSERGIQKKKRNSFLNQVNISYYIDIIELYEKCQAVISIIYMYIDVS